MSRSEVSWRVSIQRDNCDNGAKAMSWSLAGRECEPGSVAVRMKRSRTGAAGCPGNMRIPARSGRHRRRRKELARTGASFVQRSHRFAPIARGCFALRRAELELHQLFGFGEGGSGNRRSYFRRSAESRRSARCGVWRKPRRVRRWFTARSQGGHESGRDSGCRTVQKSAPRIWHVDSIFYWYTFIGTQRI